MKSIPKIHFITYLILLGLTLLMAIASVAASVTGNIDILTGGLAATVFIIFAVLQIVCLALYQPAFTPYKIGFYLMHIGLLILLAGLSAYALAGESITVQVPVSSTGSYYTQIQNEDGEMTDLGFAFKLTEFTVEKYESGNDKYYRADVAFTDPATLLVEEDYLEVNRTLRRNGWKLYLMDYSDGLRNLAALGLTQESFYETYSADGANSGSDLLDLIYQDIAGTRYNYYLYDEANSRFIAITEEQISITTGSLWAYTFESEGMATVYLTKKNGAFAETFSGTGNEILAHVAEAYPEARVSYYQYDIGYGAAGFLHDESIPEEEGNAVAQITDKVYAYIRDNGDAGITVYIMTQEMKPSHSFSSSEGGSALLAEIAGVCGEQSAEISYMIYSPQASGYTRTEELDVAALNGELRAYAVNMNGQALIYVHPLSIIILIKHDPGEWATIAGMILVMLGAVLMCLIRGRKKNFTPNDEKAAETASGSNASPKAVPKQSAQSKHTAKSKGGRKR